MVIFDLDGTLVNINSIEPLIGQWEEFHEASMECPANEPMVSFFNALQEMGYECIILTGKPDSFYQRTVSLLAGMGVYPEAIGMRPKDNSQSDTQLKVAKMEARYGLNWQERVAFAVDDRDKMIEAWRAEGIMALQCAQSLY